jgi:hypothetical protein
LQQVIDMSSAIMEPFGSDAVGWFPNDVYELAKEPLHETCLE